MMKDFGNDEEMMNKKEQIINLAKADYEIYSLKWAKAHSNSGRAIASPHEFPPTLVGELNNSINILALAKWVKNQKTKLKRQKPNNK